MTERVRRLTNRVRRLGRQVVRVLVVAVIVWFVLRVLVAYVLAG